MDSMTAKVSLFARAYHTEKDGGNIFYDENAIRLLGADDYRETASNMISGREFFFPGFEGTDEEVLSAIVNRQLAPSVIGRSAFNDECMAKADSCQYIIFGAGYDTYSYSDRHRVERIFEVDLPQVIVDKTAREKAAGLEVVGNRVFVPADLGVKSSFVSGLYDAGFDRSRDVYCTMLGLSYYMTKEAFRNLAADISHLSDDSCTVCFDYPLREGSFETDRNRDLAKACGEEMKAEYDSGEMENLMRECGFEVTDYLDSDMINKRFFSSTGLMKAPEGAAYILAEKK